MRDRFCFVHASDLHLDTPFQGIRRASPRIAEALCNASLNAWDALVRLAIERKAAFLLLAGDVYDGADRGVRAQLHFFRGLGHLSDHGIRTFIVHGNHDPLDGWSAIRDWPPGVKVFGSEDVESVPVEFGSERVATVYGISYPRRDVTENLALRFRRGPEPGLHIALLHCNVGGIVEHAMYSPCSLDDLRASRMDYWALGHIHCRQFLSQRHPWIVYPGNLQGRSPNPSELGPKGAVVVEVEDDEITEVNFQAVDQIRFVILDVDVSDLQDLPGLHGALRQRAHLLRDEHEGRGLILRVALTGRGDVHRDLRRPGVLQELLRELRREADVEETGVLWWDDIRDETLSTIEREAVLRRGDFSAELLKLGSLLKNDPERLSRFLQDRFAPLKKAVLPTWALERAEGHIRQLIENAEDLALDLLQRAD